jgi:hypothetical protein
MVYSDFDVPGDDLPRLVDYIYERYRGGYRQPAEDKAD